MADRKISELTALTTPATGDLIPIVDVSEAAAADKNKSITVQELFKGVPDGTEAAPGLAFESDDGNGIYKPGADQVAISTGGTGRLFVDSSGNISIGTSGGQKFNVIGSGVSGGVEYAARFSNGAAAAADNAVAVLLGDSSDHRVEIRATTVDSNNGYFSLYTLGGGTRSEKLRITSDGKVGIGNSTPGSYYEQADNLVVGSTSNNGITIVSGTTSNGRIHFADGTTGNEAYRGFLVYDHNSDAMQLGAAGDVAIHIDSSRHVGINTATPGSDYVLDCAGAARFSGGNGYVSFGDNGYIRTDASNELRFQGGTGGITFWKSGLSSESARFDDSGRLLIGFTTVGAKSAPAPLQVVSGSDATAINVLCRAGNDYGLISFADNDASENLGLILMQRTAADTGRMGFYINNGGTDSSQVGQLISSGFMKWSNNNTYYNGSGTYHESNTSLANNIHIFRNSNASDAYGIYIDYSGGTMNDTSHQFIVCDDGTGGNRFVVRSNGGIANYQANNVNLCDEREKKNIEALDSTWGCLKNWDLKKFHYNEDADTDDKRYGVIAQQIEPHCPEVISHYVKHLAEEAVLDEDGNVVTPAQEEVTRMAVKEQQMMWMAIKALQEAQTRIEALEAQVAALEAG